MPSFSITLSRCTNAISPDWKIKSADGTIVSEKIIHDAGAKSEIGHTRDFFVKMIKDAGYIPVERDALYNELKIYE